MKKLLNKKSGFTLIELMIVVAILGILAAVAIPAFATYLRRSKTAEAYENIESMFKSVSAYYNKEFVTDASITSTTNAHCSVVASNTFDPGDIDDVKHPQTETTNFREDRGLGFQVGPSYYSYRNNGQLGTCAQTPNTGATLWAVGDLDNDNTVATFSLAILTNAGNEFYKAGQLYIQNELE